MSFKNGYLKSSPPIVCTLLTIINTPNHMRSIIILFITIMLYPDSTSGPSRRVGPLARKTDYLKAAKPKYVAFGTKNVHLCASLIAG